MLDGVRKMAQLPRRAHERLHEAEGTSPTAAPTPLDQAFTRMSAGLPQRDGDAGPLRG
jgi:capsule polysaccharide modification protein KpsS